MFKMKIVPCLFYIGVAHFYTITSLPQKKNIHKKCLHFTWAIPCVIQFTHLNASCYHGSACTKGHVAHIGFVLQSTFTFPGNTKDTQSWFQANSTTTMSITEKQIHLMIVFLIGLYSLNLLPSIFIIRNVLIAKLINVPVQAYHTFNSCIFINFQSWSPCNICAIRF